MNARRLFLLLLCALLALSAVGCRGGETASSAAASSASVSSASASGAASGPESAVAASSEEPSASSEEELPPYAHREIRLVDQPDNWRVNGRSSTVIDDNAHDAVAYDHAAQGFFFTADCEGDVILHLSLSADMRFMYRVDGEQHEVTVSMLVPDPCIVLAEGLPRGQHSFEVYRCNELYIGLASLNTVELNGVLLPYQAPQRDLKMIFLGDSITAGRGMLSVIGDAKPDAIQYSDATKTYAFLCGEALNADFYLLAQSGMNTALPDSGDASRVYFYYDNVCWRRSTSNKFDNAAEDVDIFVISLGTNGGKFPDSEFSEQIRALITRVRGDHPDAKIVWAYGQLVSTRNGIIRKTVEDMMKTDSNLYYYCFTRPNNASGYYHPDAESQERDGRELTEFIRENVLK